MTRQLHITVNFLTGRYHGEEWPPSPARLFQALLAGAVTGCRKLINPGYREAMAWLENLAPPTIVAPDVFNGFTYKVFAPNNDSDAPGIVALLKNGIPLPDSIRKQAMLTQKVFQPRFAGNPEDMAVHYIWRLPAGQNSEDERHPFEVCRLARQMLALGWGIDVAAGNGEVLKSETPLPVGKHYSRSDGKSKIALKSPAPGFLSDLENSYAAFRQRTQGVAVSADTRPKAYSLVPYRLVDDSPQRMFVAFDLRDDKGKWCAFPWENGMLIASWMRHQARKRFQIEGGNPKFIDTYVSGHQSKGQENSRLSYVPLPSIGHEHADGKHRRALIVMPFNDDGKALSILSRMAGDELVSLTGETMAWLSRAERDAVIDHYLSESKTWLSVTPVILHGMVSDNGRFRYRKAEKLILQAIVESGYDAGLIDEFSYQPSPYWRGTGAAFKAQVPKHLSQWPKYHVRVVFKQPVKGPILVGIGRHYGLGVFAAA
jgi:CRISPR-associated protein Csb2